MDQTVMLGLLAFAFAVGFCAMIHAAQKRDKPRSPYLALLSFAATLYASASLILYFNEGAGGGLFALQSFAAASFAFFLPFAAIKLFRPKRHGAWMPYAAASAARPPLFFRFAGRGPAYSARPRPGNGSARTAINLFSPPSGPRPSRF